VSYLDLKTTKNNSENSENVTYASLAIKKRKRRGKKGNTHSSGEKGEEKRFGFCFVRFTATRLWSSGGWGIYSNFIPGWGGKKEKRKKRLELQFSAAAIRRLKGKKKRGKEEARVRPRRTR